MLRLRRAQQAVAPLECRAQRPLPRGGVPRPASKRVQRLRQPGVQFLGAEDAHAGAASSTASGSPSMRRHTWRLPRRWQRSARRLDRGSAHAPRTGRLPPPARPLRGTVLGTCTDSPHSDARPGARAPRGWSQARVAPEQRGQEIADERSRREQMFEVVEDEDSALWPEKRSAAAWVIRLARGSRRVPGRSRSGRARLCDGGK